MHITAPAMLFVLASIALAATARTSSGAAPLLPPGVTQPLALAPGPNNPRNSEGDFIHLADGKILFIYTHFTGGTGDAAAAHLASRLSSDAGKTWSDKDEVVVPRPEGVQNIMSVSLLRLKDRRIALFYLVKTNLQDCRAVLSTSGDEGKTWSAPRLCMSEVNNAVVNNNRAIQLKTGRILLPTAIHTRPDKPGFFPGLACCYLSDDAGQTWRRSKSLMELAKSRSGLQEPLVVELGEGRLMMLCRTDQGSPFRSYSSDQGDTWTEPAATDLASPLSPTSIARIPKTNDLLIVWNDHSKIDPTLKNKRTPLTVAISKDEGQTWTNRKTLYAEETGWYCYTAISFTPDGNVLLGHCAGQQTKTSSGLATTVITAFTIDWLYK